MDFFKSADQYYKEMTSTLTDVDVSKHDLIYNSLTPSSYEFSYQSMMLDEAVKKGFAKSALENAYYEYLEERCSEMGVDRKLATYAQGTINIIGKKDSKLPSGSLVATKLGLTYTTQSDVVIDDLGGGYTTIVASDKGSRFNVEAGEINSLPVGYEGILDVTNETKISNGYDDETYEALYERYLIKVRTPATSGNKYHYLNWALEVDGCGSAKVYPLWAGNGTVKVVIANSNKRAATPELIQSVKTHIDPYPESSGSGQAPIGATVTIVSAVEKAINVTANIKVATGFIIQQIQTEFTQLLTKYLEGVAFEATYISINRIGNIVFDTSGVIDYSDLKINGVTTNIALQDEEIAVVGKVELGVIS